MKTLTADRLRELIFYDPDTGIFTWRVAPRNACRRAGDVAGANNSGHWKIGIGGGVYGAHRLAWLYMTGEMPNMQIDHKNMVGTDNRWSNLRLATKSQNLANSRARKDNFSGFKGAYYDKKSGKWRAQVRHNGKLHSLGRFPTPREANAAYLVAASKLFGEFARAG